MKDVKINFMSVFERYSTVVFDLLSFSVATDLDEITIVHDSIQQNAPILELKYQDM